MVLSPTPQRNRSAPPGSHNITIKSPPHVTLQRASKRSRPNWPLDATRDSPTSRRSPSTSNTYNLLGFTDTRLGCSKAIPTGHHNVKRKALFICGVIGASANAALMALAIT
jgi:hypothetical protein